MNYIDQGTVIYGMRSEKYPEKMCYAIIISARCDIANDKISKLYYLTAVNAREWFCTENGFNEVYSKVLEDKKKNFKNSNKKYKINFDLLLTMPYETAVIVLEKNEKNEKKRANLIGSFTEIYQYVGPLNFDSRRKFVKANSSPAVKFLDKIVKGHINHYFFLPKRVYENSEIGNDGLIVDLQEIGILSMYDAKCLKSPGIDFQILSEMDTSEQERLTKTYWLENCDDFVEIEGVVRSPWCELLMQRFSNDFIRIGVDGTNEHDYKELIDQM